jgi:hypothetical protein
MPSHEPLPVVPFTPTAAEPEPAPPVLPPAAVEPEPVAPYAAPVPEFADPAPSLVSIVAPEPPSLPATTYRVLVRLDSDEQIEVAAHADPSSARGEAATLMRYLRDGRGDWPFVGDRFIRPDRIVSVDIEETHF